MGNLQPSGGIRSAWFPQGAIITDNGKGFPWIKNVTGTWWRQGNEKAMTWNEILAWHQAAIDDPDEPDTTEPFRPVLMVAAQPVPQPNRIDLRRAIERTEAWRVFGFNIEPILDAILALSPTVGGEVEDAGRTREIFPGIFDGLDALTIRPKEGSSDD